MSWMRIQLTQGQSTIVDLADFEWLSQWKWHYSPHRKTGYAVWRDKINGRKVNLRMHRLIMNAQGKTQVDHKYGDGLDNRRSQLRLCTDSQNKANRPKNIRKEGLKGAYWQKQINRWYSRINFEGSSVYLGTFDSAEKAHEAYMVAAKEYYGEFACG